MAAVLAAAPIAAQTTNETVLPPAQAPASPPPSTPTPAPAGDAVGPPQLRDFSLPGTVTQPAAPPAQTPAPVQRETPPRPAPSATAEQPPARPRAQAPVEATPAVPDPGPAPAPAPEAFDLPPTAADPLIPDALPPSAPADTTDAPPAGDDGPVAWWPWLAAVMALGLGGGLLWWRRQQQGRERYAADEPGLGALVASTEALPTPPLPRAAATPPLPLPRGPLPGKTRPRDEPEARAPQPAAPQVPPARPAPSAAPTPAVPDGIISSRLKPELGFELVPLRAETDAAEGAALTFDVVVVNHGSAPARDILVETRLINAGPRVDAEVGAFFQQPAGSGDRVPLIPPMGRVALRSRISLAAKDLAPLVVEGRKLFVPMVAINAHYRWSGGVLANSSSFLVGRGDAEGGKMAPFRLDRGARSWSDLAVRQHSTGLR